MLNIAGLEQLFQSREDMEQNPQNIPLLIPGVHSLEQTEMYLDRINKFLGLLNLGNTAMQDYYMDSVAIALHYVRNMRTGDFKHSPHSKLPDCTEREPTSPRFTNPFTHTVKRFVVWVVHLHPCHQKE